mmetsp:Transcript_132902/g.230941  ORF Transcript_132902/g.230941 Transcript_132902/m.230941 type:complete len:390 (-) Transcript_132902:109-1278(-)
MHGTRSAFPCLREEGEPEGSLDLRAAEDPEGSLDQRAAEVPELAPSNVGPLHLPTSTSFESTSASSLPGSAPRATRSPCWADLCEDTASDGEPSSSSLPPVSVRSLPIRVDSDTSLAPTSSDEQGNRLEDSPSSLSVGSRDHAAGTCHPCIFFPKAQGCVYGWHCTFCHFDHDSKARHRRHLRGGRRRDPDVASGVVPSSTTGSEAESGSAPSTASVEEKFLLPSALVYHAPQPWPTGPLPPRSAARGRGKGRGLSAPRSAGPPGPTAAPYPEADSSITSMLTSVFAPWFTGEASNGEHGAAELGTVGAIVEEENLQSCSGAEASSSSKDNRYRAGPRSQAGNQSSQSNKDASSEGTPTMGQWIPGGARPSRSSARGAGADRRHKPRTR